MGNIFNSDSGFSKFMNRIADLFILNILWIFCSIPIITIGATTTALYSVNLKFIDNEEGNLIKTFFKSFKENFKKSTIIWLIILSVSIILGVNLVFWLKCGLSLSYFALPFIFFSLFIFLLVIPYIFLILTKTKCSILNIFKYCFIISLKNLPYSVLIVLFGASVLFATFYFPIVFLFMLILGVALHSYMTCRIFLIVFNKDIHLFNKIIS
ncbi:MAG: YesL family protein [Clostridium celatum]|nr:YesL family protein [Clostridium celatum]